MSFSTLPNEIHRLIFNQLTNSSQTRCNFLRNGVPDIFGNGHRRKSDGKTLLCIIHPAWRDMIQEELFSELNLPHVLTTAEEDVDELRLLVLKNPELSRHIKVLNVNGPYGGPATIQLWQRLFTLLPHLSLRQLKFQPYINAVTGPFERLGITGREDEERFLLDDYTLEVETAACEELVFHCSLGDSMEISQLFVRQIITNTSPKSVCLETTDWRRSRAFRRKLYEGICLTVQTLHHLTSFTLTYPGMRPVDERKLAFPLCKTDKLGTALRILSKQLIHFVYDHGRVSHELFDEQEWPRLESYGCVHDPIDAYGDWWSHHEEGEVERDEYDDTLEFDEIPSFITSKRTHPKIDKQNAMAEVVLSAMLHMPRLKKLLFMDRRMFLNKSVVAFDTLENGISGRFVAPYKSKALEEWRRRGVKIRWENWLE